MIIRDSVGVCVVVSEVDRKRLHWKLVNLDCCSRETVPSHYFIVFPNDHVMWFYVNKR